MTEAAIHASEWLNTDDPPVLEQLKGRVVVVEAFQMLCPGCVTHGLPQALRIRQTFRPEDVVVLGLHSVFEHHEAMTPGDQPGRGPMPRTMAEWGLEGTPSLILFDRQGRMRARHLGQVSDMAVGAEIMQLVMERGA